MPLRALRWFVVALAVSLFGAIEGSHLMASLNDPVPTLLDALHANADPIPASPRAPTRQVVVVLVDGLGADAFDARLREGILGDAPWRVALDSGVPSRSRPVYHAILTGVPQWAAGIRGNAFATERADSVPDRVRAGGGRVAWMLEALPWFHELSGGPGDIVVEGGRATSPEMFARVLEQAPDLVVVHLLDVDDVGHLHGGASAEYTDASRRVMQIVASFRSVARGRPGGDGAIWFVGADHGHTAHGGHGGPEASVRRVTWAVFDDRDASTDPGIPTADATVSSLAPTIARALGVDPPRESIADGLPLFPSTLGQPFVASAARVGAVREARARAEASFLGSASSRGALIAAVLFTMFAAVVGLRRKRGLAELVVFAVATGGFLVAGPGLSMSSVRTEGWYLLHALSVLTAFAVVAWLVARRWASAMAVAAESVVFPVLALVATRGSLGVSDVSPLETVLVPSFGLVPASVCAAVAIVETLSWFICWMRVASQRSSAAMRTH